MEKRDVKKVVSKLPDGPGVYFFIQKKKILYIGKATSLRDRVKSYMSKTVFDTRGPLIEKMLREFDDIKHIKTDSVLEALILEANLIKKHQPEANTAEKDDKSFNYVVITKEDFPRVLVMRGRELEKLFKPSSRENPREERRRRTEENFSKNFPWFSRDAAKNNFVTNIFGPFPNGGQLKEAIKIVRKMFPFRDKCIPFQNKPCFNRQIGLCPGVCTGEISKKDYTKQIKNIVLFFEGKKKLLVKRLEKEMKELARKREFEKAGKIKRQIFALYHIQDVALIKENYKNKDASSFRIESYDVAHLSGTNVVGVMTVVEDGEVKKSDYRKFKVKNNPGINDTKSLSEILTRRLAHTEWPMPNLIVVDGGVAQKRTMEKILKEKRIQIPVVSVVKDEKHRPREILGIKKWFKYERDILLSNAEAHRFAISFHKHLRSKLF